VPPPKVERLSDRHDRTVFASGVDPLDRYLRTQASQDVRRRVAACFLLVAGDDPAKKGYYTLAAARVALIDLSEKLAKRLPCYPTVPAILMGRLTVDVRYRTRRFGEFLLFDAFSRALRSDIASYAFIVDAKDDSAARFYSRYRFLSPTRGGRRLFLPMTEVAKLFA
jgi:GNAT superfamily N-acetyltransferase